MSRLKLGHVSALSLSFPICRREALWVSPLTWVLESQSRHNIPSLSRKEAGSI